MHSYGSRIRFESCLTSCTLAVHVSLFFGDACENRGLPGFVLLQMCVSRFISAWTEYAYELCENVALVMHDAVEDLVKMHFSKNPSMMIHIRTRCKERIDEKKSIAITRIVQLQRDEMDPFTLNSELVERVSEISQDRIHSDAIVSNISTGDSREVRMLKTELGEVKREQEAQKKSDTAIVLSDTLKGYREFAEDRFIGESTNAFLICTNFETLKIIS